MNVVNGAALTLVYLMAVGSWTTWDVAAGIALAALALLWVNRLVIPRLPRRPVESIRFSAAPFARVALAIVLDFAAGSFRALWLLARGGARPGFIYVRTEADTDGSRALSAFLLTVAPDSFVVQFDEERNAFVVHLLDLSRAADIQREHEAQYRRDIAPLFASD